MNKDTDSLNSVITNSEENNSENTSFAIETPSDYRIEWIWYKLKNFLNLENSHKYLFEKLLKENDVEENLNKFLNFNSIEEITLDSIVLFFYKTYRSEIIQEQVAVWEENKGRSQRATKNSYGKVDKTDDEKKKKGKKVKKGKKDDNNETLSTLFSGVTTTHMYLDVDADEEDNPDLGSPEDYKDKSSTALAPSFAPIPGEEDKYILTQKVIDKVIEIPVIHMIPGKINFTDPELLKRNFYYLLRTTDQKIPCFESQQQCNSCMFNYITVGSLNGNFLEFLNEILINVLKPLLENQYHTPASDTQVEKQSKKLIVETNIKQLLEYLNELIDCVQWNLSNSEDNLLLPVPKSSDINLELEQAENIVLNWEKHISKVLDNYKNKVRQGLGPTAEYDYWHERLIGLSILVESLNSPSVKMIKSVLNEARSSILSAFHWYEIELWNYYTEARDNDKFLFTVLRHFKLITESNNFKAINECFPSLMEGIKMIWILSKYYNTEEKMTCLLESISWQLCQNIKNTLSVKELFRKPLKEILEQTASAYTMLKNWKNLYFTTRKSIELSEKGKRWEFDNKRLFNEIEYIAKVSNDFNEIASVLESYYNIFGAELKSIISDPSQIDVIVKRVDELIVPILNADFNIFNKFNQENWDATMAWFYLEVNCLQKEALFLIDDYFKTLINAEQALEVLIKFKTFKTRPAIQKCLLSKFEVIMQQFSKEINQVQDIFHSGKNNPPLLKYHLPIAGSIFWVRQLLSRLQGPVNTFKHVPELDQSNLKSLVFSQYLDAAKQIKQFQDTKFDSWNNKFNLQVLNSMKENILKVIPINESNTGKKILFSKDLMNQESKIVNSHPAGLKIGSSLKCLANKVLKLQTDKPSRKTKVTWMEKKEEKTMIEQQLSFKVNFDLKLFHVIHEAEMLEHLKFQLPISLRDKSIQKDRLKVDIELTQTVIDHYNKLMNQLDPADIVLLKNIIKSIDKYIQSGVTRLNWYYLDIPNYAAHSEKLLKNLESIIAQINHIKKDLDGRIDKISTYNLITITNLSNLTPPSLKCNIYFSEIKLARTKSVNEMLKVYLSITPILIKLESLVKNTTSGKSLAMKLFYQHYEQKIFSALVTCMKKNLQALNILLLENEAIFTVDAVLLSSEVVLRPSPNEINIIIVRDIKDMLEKLKIFPRWLTGSCQTYTQPKERSTDGLSDFNFYQDVMSIQIINDYIVAIQNTVEKLTTECWKYLNRWKKYSNLWRADKSQVCEKFVSTCYSLNQYDEKFTFYDTIIEEIEEWTSYYDISSIRINLVPLLKSIKDHAQKWKQILGDFLLSETKQSMKKFSLKIDIFRSEIELVINSLDKFKAVMQTIADIKKMSIQAIVQYDEYKETFKILKAHEITFSADLEEQAYVIQQDWQFIHSEALYRDIILETTKDRFRQITETQIADLQKECDEFAVFYNENGPASVGSDLDSGLIKVEEFGELINSLEKRRLDLAYAENLFNLLPTNFSIFEQVKQNFNDIKTIYCLYKTQKDAEVILSKTAWSDLNFQKIIEEIESYIKEFEKLPDRIQKLDVGQVLLAKMEAFKNSVLLFVELKHEAIRERHWKELMEKTGKHFDISSDKIDRVQ